MTTLSAVIEALLATLSTDLGAFDLNTPDQVQEGTFDEPPGSVAFAAVSPAALADSVPQGRGPDWYLETYQTDVRVWAPVLYTTAENQAQRSRALLGELQAALDNARSSLGSAIWRCVYWRVSATRPDLAAASSDARWASVNLTITFTFRRASGSGA